MTMGSWQAPGMDLFIICLLVLGIFQFRNPKGARRGNLTAALAILCAIVLILYRNGSLNPGLTGSALILGGGVGWFVALRVSMIQIPAMVAFQHGAGGIAAFLISLVELTRETSESLPAIGEISGVLGLVIGAATFSGSMIASGKLADKINQKPVVLSRHSLTLSVVALAILLTCILVGQVSFQAKIPWLIILLVLSIVLGILFSIRIGGADMPVLISFLNATAGLAAAFCGVIIQNRLLIACGATVAASGSVLTHVMCRAMNRRLNGVFLGNFSKPAIRAAVKTQEGEGETEGSPPMREKGDGFVRALSTARAAERVVIIPGYGMALAQAQFGVAALAHRLEVLGKTVRFAIHPVAGRMPGHMNVLLAEADVDYEKLIEMDEINPEFAGTDLALIVGACDVVNPAAIDQEGTPISGMPVLMAHEAKAVVVCNRDDRPGYSGVENPLYTMKKTIPLFGDAKETVGRLLGAL